MSDQVLIGVEGAVGRLRLNRPEALNALDEAMCQTMSAALLAWRGMDSVKAVVIDHATGRGFCAGGDIRMLAESGRGDGSKARAFFFAEYRLNHLLKVYEKPVIALMDGVTMGGGVGISVHNRFRVATERSRFAMPETGIGLFPDVGGGWFLPRLPGAIGAFLALTGARLDPAECLYAGLATHYVESAHLPALLGGLQASDLSTDPEAAIEALLARFATDPGPARLSENRAAIDRFFAGDDAEALFAALAADGGPWAARELATLKTKSPQTIKLALRQLRTGAKTTDFAANMAMEYRIGCRVVHRHDFLEGVRAVIIDKDQAPRWAPATLEAVDPAQIEAMFAPLPEAEEWRPFPELAAES